MWLFVFIFYELILSSKIQPTGGFCRRTGGLQTIYNGIALLEFQDWAQKSVRPKSDSPSTHETGDNPAVLWLDEKGGTKTVVPFN
jgi:hypothetical protein